MTVALRLLLDVARFAAVDLAHELRRDYERGVFQRQTLAVVVGMIVVAVAAISTEAWVPAIAAFLVAASLTYVPARADRRWRDDRRDDP